MKKLIAVCALLAPFMLTPAMAASAQQGKMASCNKEAGDKKGDERKAFMKECLSNKPKADEGKSAKTAQQEKMKTCNAEAKGKKGDERKKFMSECLKKD